MNAVKTRVAGITYENRDGTSRQAFAKLARKGDKLALRREPDNQFDPYALAVDWVDDDGAAFQIGYVPRGLAMLLAPLADEGARLSAEVIRAGGGGLQPVGLRMRIEVDTGTLPADRQVSGLEPALEYAAQLPDNIDPGLAPSLGSLRRQSQ